MKCHADLCSWLTITLDQQAYPCSVECFVGTVSMLKMSDSGIKQIDKYIPNGKCQLSRFNGNTICERQITMVSSLYLNKHTTIAKQVVIK